MSRFVNLLQRLAAMPPAGARRLDRRARPARALRDRRGKRDSGRSRATPGSPPGCATRPGRMASPCATPAAPSATRSSCRAGSATSSARKSSPMPRNGCGTCRRCILSAQLPDGSWVNARMITPRPDPWIAVQAAGSTLLIYLLILAAMVWIAVRLARPLRDLTAAAERFEGPRRGPAGRAARPGRRPPRHPRLQRDERPRLGDVRREGPDARRDRPRSAHAFGLAAHPRRKRRARGGARQDDRHHRGDDGDARRHAGARPLRAARPRICGRSTSPPWPTRWSRSSARWAMT